MFGTSSTESVFWTSLSALADQVGAALRQAEGALALEQAVHGLDTMSEVALQNLLQEQLEPHFAVTREVHYPSSFGAKRPSRQRCDLVLAPTGTQLLPESHQQLSLHLAPSGPAPRLCDPTEAFWLEVKVAYQFRPGGLHHKGYSAQLRQALLADIHKMAAEPRIHHAALLLIVFNESVAVASKDLDLFEMLILPKEGTGSREVRSLDIQERIGHRLCTIALWPIFAAARNGQRQLDH